VSVVVRLRESALSVCTSDERYRGGKLIVAVLGIQMPGCWVAGDLLTAISPDRKLAAPFAFELGDITTSGCRNLGEIAVSRCSNVETCGSGRLIGISFRRPAVSVVPGGSEMREARLDGRRRK
jgi:hypothetical protein